MDPYAQPKRTYDGGFEVCVHVGASGDDQTLLAALQTTPLEAPKQHVIHVQRVTILPLVGSGGVTWQIKGSDGLVVLTAALSMATADGTPYVRDFGPQGIPLTINTDVVLDVSAPGAVGDIYIEGFQARSTEDI